MSVRAQQYEAVVVRREQLSPHFVRIVLGGPGLSGFESTGIPDEWVGLIVPGQFQSRYYTVRAWDARPDGRSELTLDIVVHDHGLVTEWASLPGIVGQTVTITEPKGSFELPPDAQWLLLVGDLTALPAMARIAESFGNWTQNVRIWVESPETLTSYLQVTGEVAWVESPGDGESELAAVVEGIDWPSGTGYFWMAGESSQMRAIRKHLMRDRGLPSHAYDVMGYWRGGAIRQPRAIDPGPIWRDGKARGLSDDQIWQQYDEAAQQ